MCLTLSITDNWTQYAAEFNHLETFDSVINALMLGSNEQYTKIYGFKTISQFLYFNSIFSVVVSLFNINIM